jgi:hypothetical protein
MFAYLVTIAVVAGRIGRVRAPLTGKPIGAIGLANRVP